MAQPTIPTLDLNHFLQGDCQQQQRFISSLDVALRNIGFFILQHPGIDPTTIQTAYGAATAFFDLPAITKHSYISSASLGGFTPFGREHAKDSALSDLKEFWHVNRISLTASNAPWPREIPTFRPAMVQLYRQLDICANHLLQACALALDQPRFLLTDRVINGTTVLRLANYPLITATMPSGSLRAAPHEDINFITLLCTATAPGLEVLTHQGDWLPVQAQPHQLIVDTGDMLQNLTNGLFKSTTHRVVNASPQQRRLSMPFFVHPRPDVDLTPHPDCVQRSGGSPQFPSISAADYLAQRLREIGVV